jgi:hypothetical protein
MRDGHLYGALEFHAHPENARRGVGRQCRWGRRDDFDVIAPRGKPWEATVFTSRNSLWR